MVTDAKPLTRATTDTLTKTSKQPTLKTQVPAAKTKAHHYHNNN